MPNTYLINNLFKFFNLIRETNIIKLIEESKIFERRRNSQNFEEMFREAVDRLKFIVENKSTELIHIFELNDEDNSTDFELAILKAFLDCKLLKFIQYSLDVDFKF